MKIAAVTYIITSMLQAARLTETYLQPAVVCFEQDTDPGNIEEEDPENNVQPGEAGIGLDIDNEEDLDEHLDELVVVDVDVVEPNNKKKSTGSVDLKRKFGSA